MKIVLKPWGQIRLLRSGSILFAKKSIVVQKPMREQAIFVLNDPKHGSEVMALLFLLIIMKFFSKR